MYLETYIDHLGHFQAVDIFFLIQYLFLTFPRIIFMLGFVMMLSFLLGATCALFCTWLPPTRPLTSGTMVTGLGAIIAATWPGPCQQIPRSTGTFTPMGFGATLERSSYLPLHLMRERRTENGKCYCHLNIVYIYLYI